MRSSNEGDPDFGPPLAEICAEIEADRATLEQVMEQLGIARGRMKPAAAWAAEKFGRLKLNGQLTGYSPLSRLVELEGLQMGIGGKMRMWRALEQSVGKRLGGVDFGELAARAERQQATVEELQLEAVSRALPSLPVDRSSE